MSDEHVLRDADDVTEEIVDLAIDIVTGWYGSDRIDWEDVWDRLDGAELSDGSILDLGEDLTSPALKRIRREVQEARRT